MSSTSNPDCSAVSTLTPPAMYPATSPSPVRTALITNRPRVPELASGDGPTTTGSVASRASATARERTGSPLKSSPTTRLLVVVAGATKRTTT